MAMFENAMMMFTPFYGQDGEALNEPKQPAPASEPESGDIDDLREQMLEMQRQLAKLSGGK